jgi:hypothetical protein
MGREAGGVFFAALAAGFAVAFLGVAVPLVLLAVRVWRW